MIVAVLQLAAFLLPAWALSWFVDWCFRRNLADEQSDHDRSSGRILTRP